MTGFLLDWVDAFSDRPFGGNGCAVVHDGAALDDATCMQIVRETSLVECTFTGPSQVADLKVRYFLASREIPFAGHPTLATAAALRARGLAGPGPVSFETGAGIITVGFDGARIEMIQPAPVFGIFPDPARVAAAVGLRPDDFVAPPQVVSTGLPFCITLLRDHAALRRAVLNPGALATLATSLGQPGTDTMEPFLVTLAGATAAGDTFSRLLMTPPSPPEDPFTGSASGAMAAYLFARGLIGESFVAEQGHWMGRPGQARLRLLGTREAITGVAVSGQAHVLIQGEMRLPA
ncbi:MAG: PhzF family phenazine biosynthesis protein [Rhodobacteraceae bacterium]|nr:PhzF family phenazine biosynthesis protein [Paracoccaceae bacterium]